MIKLLDKYPGWTIGDVMELTFEQIDFLLRDGKPVPTGVPIVTADDLPRATEKLHRRKLREIYGR